MKLKLLLLFWMHSHCEWHFIDIIFTLHALVGKTGYTSHHEELYFQNFCLFFHEIHKKTDCMYHKRCVLKNLTSLIVWEKFLNIWTYHCHYHFIAHKQWSQYCYDISHCYWKNLMWQNYTSIRHFHPYSLCAFTFIYPSVPRLNSSRLSFSSSLSMDICI